jgi:hypothetical protein
MRDMSCDIRSWHHLSQASPSLCPCYPAVARPAYHVLLPAWPRQYNPGWHTHATPRMPSWTIENPLISHLGQCSTLLSRGVTDVHTHSDHGVPLSFRRAVKHA